MAEADQAQKTEPATPKRRKDAREKGEVAQSRDLTSVAVLVGAFLVLSLGAGAVLLRAAISGMRHAFQSAAHPPSSLAGYHIELLSVAGPPALAMLPLIVVFAASGSMAQLLQAGPLISGKAIQPKLERMNPLKGLKRIVSIDSLVNLAKAIIQVSIVSAVAWAVVQSELEVLIGLQRLPLTGQLLEIGRMTRTLVVAVLCVLAALAVVDLLWQRYRYDKKLRMTKQEVRDEIKQQDGDPLLRSHRRAIQRDLSRSRMIAAVADADVVITNPTHFAVALAYERDAMAAPKVLAKGRGHVALKIREAARAADVPIVENKPLARVLHDTTKVGHEIPENLYKTVAEVLAHVYRLSPARARRFSGVSG